jgi:hypothetical protein
MNEDYKKGYRDGFKDGFEASQPNKPYIPSPTYPTVTVAQPTKCSTCKVEFGTGTWGYVCYKDRCPMQISWKMFQNSP